MSRTRRSLTAAAIVAALAVPTTLAATTSAEAARKPATAVGLVDGTKLVQFPLSNARKARTLGTLKGFSGGDSELVGIDFRVQDKRLYGVGDNGGVYRVGNRGTLTLVNRLSVPLQGKEFGVDFNPAADRLRIISDTGQNLRHDLGATENATIADGTLTYPATPTTPAKTGTGITAAAYTNNDLDDRTGTVLYDIDTAADQLVLQAPANAGTLALVGKLRRAAGVDAGFDIDQRNRGWAVLPTVNGQRLFSVDLSTGRTTFRSGFPKALSVTDLAIRIGR